MSAADPTVLPAAAPAPPAKMSPLAKAGIALAVVLLLMLVSWYYGRSTMAPARGEAEAARLRAMVLESRTQVLDAQVSLYTTNFGSAARHLEYAKPPLTAAAATLNGDGRTELATKVDTALQQVEAGRELAAKLSLDANSRAGEASRLLGEVLSALPR